MKRTIYCGALRESDLGRTVTVCGWVRNKRDMGGVIFLDLRDRAGELQTVFDASLCPASAFALADGVRLQSVLALTGTVRLRDAETRNPRLATGTVELAVTAAELLSAAEPLPYDPDDPNVREALRLRYRYLDLRRPQVQENLRFRHRVVSAVRRYLDGADFTEVETPCLTKSTPEGARDYIVPSRVHLGSFYALPQSPQIFKQLLMVGGMDKYYQVARCFRDEDLRADRQPEFTQVDLELSFIEQEDILVLLEDLFKSLFRETLQCDLREPFPCMRWETAMDRYGSDKPDIRFDLPIVDVTDIAARCGFTVFRSVAEGGGVVRAIRVPGKADFTRSEIEELTACAAGLGAHGMAWIAVREDGELYSVLTKYFDATDMDDLLARTGTRPGDFLLFAADKLSAVRRILGGLRLHLGDLLGLRDPGVFRFLFVTDFPQFEFSEEDGALVSAHNPFALPREDELALLETDPARVHAQCYDVVLNGIELGSGSLRIHDRAIQRRVFGVLGLSEEQIRERFGFMLDAFRYGTPPHGGFAFGVDRLVMLMLGSSSLRDVIAFPKLGDASCPLTGAPGEVDGEQLEVLGLTAEALAAGAARRPAAKTPRIDVAATAALAMLPSDGEREMGGELTRIVAFADALSSAALSDIPETLYVGEERNVLRPDTPAPSLPREVLLALAPETREGCVSVPHAIE